MSKSNLADKVILTDCDGVLLDWLFGFKEFMADRGYTEQDDTGYAIWKRYGFINKEAGEGLFGVSFKMKGPKGELKTTINPIRTLTPRFIQKMIDKKKEAK